MLSTRNVRPLPLLAPIWLLLTLSMVGCATPSATTPPAAVSPPRLPAPPNVSEPRPSGAYLERHCKVVRTVRSTLKDLQPMSGPCYATAETLEKP